MGTGHRVRERVRAQAFREGSSASVYAAELLKEAGSPTASTSFTATRSRSTRSWSTRRSQRSRSSAPRRSRATSRDGHRAAHASARRREEEHDRPSRRRYRHGRRRGGQRLGSAGALHGGLDARCGRPRRRPGQRDPGAAAEGRRGRRDEPGLGDGAAGHASTATRWPYIEKGAAEGARSSPTDASRRRQRGFFLGELPTR